MRDANKLRILTAICIALVPLTVLGQTKVDAKQRKVTVEEGRDLVYALLKSSGCTRSKCAVNLMEDSYFPQFYFFYGSWPNPVGSPHIGSWAVDPATADVWDANVCAEYQGGALAKLQLSLRRRLRLTREAYDKLKQRPPMCESGQKVKVLTGR